MNQHANTAHVPAPHEADSHAETVKRFSKQQVAGKYPAKFGNGWRDRREMATITRLLAGLPMGARVLDLPCGTGRLLDILIKQHCTITCADASEPMVRLARKRWEELKSAGQTTSPEPLFTVCDVMNTKFPDGHFDAVICNRLFHHFSDPAVRVRALAELGRICRGPVVVSFFNSFSFDAMRRRVRYAIRGTKKWDRQPIPGSRFCDEFRAAGLNPVSTNFVTWGVSPMCYVVGMPGSQASTAKHRKAA